MKKTKLTRSLMAAVSIVALSAVMYGCVHSGSDAPQMEAPDLTPAQSAAAAAATAAMEASDAAQDAVDDVDDIRNLDAVAFLRAENAAADAMAASAKAAAESAKAAAATTLEDAEAAQEAAEAAEAAAKAAQAIAERNAGIVLAIKDANDEAERMAEAAEAARQAAAVEAAALSAAQMAASDAADAAADAASDAQAELDGQTANADADAASYAALEAAAQAANAAYMAAKAASDSAAAATMSADAATHQATAEAQRDAAQAALGDAQMYAGMVADAKAEADRQAAAAAEAERMALAAARTAADTAADDAATDSYAAMAALAGVEGMAGYDQASYDAAAAAAQAAADAATAARDASDAAGRATTSGDAEGHQMTAETQRGLAADALADAMMYAGMVTEAKRVADEAEAERLAQEAADKLLADTKQAAADAAKDAADAAMAASDVVEAQRANKDLSTIAADAFARAELHAAAAATASGEAAEANNAAQALTSTDDQDKAEMYRDLAQAAQGRAALAQTNAESWADMVAQVKQDMDDEADNDTKLAAAKVNAEKYADEARKAADDAQDAADAAEAANPGSSAAAEAQDAADAADEAADLAEAAHMRALDDTDAAEAEAEVVIAMTQKGVAAGALMTAQARQKTAEDDRRAAEQVQEERDLANAKQAAEDLYNDPADGVLFHYMAVQEKAGLAEDKAGEARDSADRAKRARTDYATANTEAGKAEAASMEAQDSLGRATTAKSDADTARQAAMDATTSADAKAALEDLKTANAALTEEHTGATGAGMDYMAARDAARDAATASDTHVLELFKLANAGHIVTAPDPDANTDLSEAELIARLKSTHRTQINREVAQAAADGEYDADASGGVGTVANNSQTTASVNEFDANTIANSTTWPYDADITDDSDEDGISDNDGDGLLQVSINIGGGTDNYTTNRGDNPFTDDETETDYPLNFGEERGLGDFEHGFAISTNLLTDTDPAVVDLRTRILVFTDKEQASAPVASERLSLTNVDVPSTNAGRISITSTPVPVPDNAAIPDNAHDFSGSYDHDGDPDTPAYVGRFDCVDPVVCSFALRGTDATDMVVEGTTTVTAISGYKFTGAATITAVPSMEDQTYLAFGVWLQDDANRTTDPVLAGRYTFGAFADGGSPYNNNVDGEARPIAAIEGTAIYNGKAAGVHATADRIDYFEGDAELRANFREDEADPALGTIIGEISNIYSGGDALSGYGDNTIYLRLSDIDADPANANNITDTGTFAGRTRLGAGTFDGDGEYNYPFNGTWQGAFYNQLEDDDDTANVNETELPPLSAAGTFGVTMPDDTDTTNVNEQESFVGAFGAHKDE